MLKWVGWVGAGRHSLTEFDIVIEDLGRPPEPEDPMPADGRPVARAFISEDFEPESGLGVDIGSHRLEPDPQKAGKWRLRRAHQ